MLRDYSKGLLVILSLASLFGMGNNASAQNRTFPQATKIADTGTFNAANQYLVYVPSTDPTTVQQVKAIAPEAFRSQLGSGQAIMQIGRFNNLNLAQHRIEELKTAGVTAQVTQVSSRLPSAPSAPDSFPTATSPVNQTGIPANAPTGIPSNNAGIATLPGVPSTPDVNPTNNTIDISRPGQPGQPVPVQSPDTPNTTAAINPPPTLSRNRYYVIVPSSVDTVLTKVRNIVPTARLTASERGTYIEVQGFPDRGSAEALNINMRSQGLDSRVIYF
jgi:hypothetical protein